MEVYYWDIVMFLIKIVLKIYSFVGFDMFEVLLKWIVVNISFSEEVLVVEVKKRFLFVCNFIVNVEKW